MWSPRLLMAFAVGWSPMLRSKLQKWPPTGPCPLEKPEVNIDPRINWCLCWSRRLLQLERPSQVTLINSCFQDNWSTSKARRQSPCLCTEIVLPRMEKMAMKMLVIFVLGMNHWTCTGTELGDRGCLPLMMEPRLDPASWLTGSVCACVPRFPGVWLWPGFPEGGSQRLCGKSEFPVTEPLSVSGVQKLN